MGRAAQGMGTMFLTLEDPRAQVKGSRDPLGVQPLWSGFGRHLVRNLTTVTTSVRSFTVLLLGRWLTERLVTEGRLHAEQAIDAFLRFEQVAGYARHVVADDGADVRGIERIRARTDAGDDVRIGTRPEDLILSDQKVYGIWGLFTVSARATGWLSGGAVGLAPPTRDFVEAEYGSRLGPALRDLLLLVERGGAIQPADRHPVLRALGSALSREIRSSEAGFYGEWLRDAAHVPGAESYGDDQAALGRALVAVVSREAELDGAAVEGLAQWAAAAGRDRLATSLTRAAVLESVLAAAAAVFDRALSGARGVSIEEFAADMNRIWPQGAACPDAETFRALGGEVRRHVGEAVGTLVDRAFLSLSTRDWGGLVVALAEWNRAVTGLRGGGPWLEVVDERIEVRYRTSERDIAPESGPARPWRNSYFLGSLRSIAWQVESAR